MTIQIIGENWGSRTGFNGIVQSPLSCPKSLDEFDVNIITLNDELLWRNEGESFSNINSINHLISVCTMVQNRKKSKVIYVLPHGFSLIYFYYSGKYHRSVLIKDKLEDIWRGIICKVLYPSNRNNILAFENTRTIIENYEYTADFYFTEGIALTKSNLSDKSTTIQLADSTLLTTLDITADKQKLTGYVDYLFCEKQKSEIPEWAKAIEFGDDCEQADIILRKGAEILDAQRAINEANKKLEENRKYKSILYTNGDELVAVVFDILEKILECDLSEFEDVKREDFLIRSPSCTFIGEIKGVTSNVKYEHISQLELHYRSYLDQLSESGTSENVKQLLIMNPFRTKPLNSRDPVHTSQVDLAVRNGCLIIETCTLLRLYEKFCAGELSTQKCIDVFVQKTGLLTLDDFADQADNIEAYMV